MGILNILFGKKKTEDNPVTKPQVQFDKPRAPKGSVNTVHDTISADNVERIKRRFIAFDLETTGLNSKTDKIIEIGAVVFENGSVADRFGSLIKIGSHIPEEASRVNHITDTMLNTQGKDPATVYREFAEFIEEALSDDTMVVAHNANFDIAFISKALEEYGYSGTLRFLDTLVLSRSHIKGLFNYKQDTVAEHLGIVNNESHRAVSDAETCGHILVRILDITVDKFKEREKTKISLLNDEERETGAEILSIINKIDGTAPKFLFYKNSANIVDVVHIWTLLKFKISKKGNYMIVPKRFVSDDISLDVKECTVSELCNVNVRVCFDNPFDLEKITDVIANIYNEFIAHGSTYENYKNYEEEFFANANMEELVDISGLVENARQRIVNKPLEKKAIEEEKCRKLQEKEQAKRIKMEQEEQKRLAKASLEQEKERLRKELLESSETYDLETIKRIVAISETQNKRAVIKLDDENNIFKVYYSLTDACNDVGLAPKTIRDVCNGKNKHGGGFCWKYADEYLENV